LIVCKLRAESDRAREKFLVHPQNGSDDDQEAVGPMGQLVAH